MKTERVICQGDRIEHQYVPGLFGTVMYRTAGDEEYRSTGGLWWLNVRWDDEFLAACHGRDDQAEARRFADGVPECGYVNIFPFTWPTFPAR